ncbi:MAG TPA: hypothetical protein VFH83_13165, partial [Spirochaetia bacterium]|nr:hypothetical protein [Spirochaetia bacterium]
DLRVSSVTSRVPLRKLTEGELDQARRQAAGEKVEVDPRWQRFGPDDVYARSLLELDQRYRRSPFQELEIQAMRIGEVALTAVPAELFTWNGMRIKTGSPVKPAYVVTCANGMIGYVGTPDAYGRGGYEVTPCIWSKVDPAAPDVLIRDALKALSGVA